MLVADHFLSSDVHGSFDCVLNNIILFNSKTLKTSKYFGSSRMTSVAVMAVMNKVLLLGMYRKKLKWLTVLLQYIKTGTERQCKVKKKKFN